MQPVPDVRTGGIKNFFGFSSWKIVKAIKMFPPERQKEKKEQIETND